MENFTFISQSMRP